MFDTNEIYTMFADINNIMHPSNSSRGSNTFEQDSIINKYRIANLALILIIIPHFGHAVNNDVLFIKNLAKTIVNSGNLI